MKNENKEIEIAIYTAVCIYNRLRKSIVEINESFVPIEDKIELSLYLGILHTQNSISNQLGETLLIKNTKINYKKLNSKEFNDLYELYFKDIINNINMESLQSYFQELLSKSIIIKLNNEYNFAVEEFINIENKKLLKK